MKKYLGQNFLYDPSILKRIIQAGGVTHEDTVVEIGPGRGRLTRMLAERAKKVIAIEIDRELYGRLKDELKDLPNIELVLGDGLRYDYSILDRFKVVANIPYYITTPIIFKLLEHKGRLTSMTLTLQREVAERMVSAPGGKDYGVLTLMVQYHGKPKIKFIIPRGAFRPVPRVDSACLHMEIRRTPPVMVKDEEFFFKVIKTAFSHRRKTIANALKPVSPFIKERLLSLGIEPVRRPETLSMEEFARLADVLR